MVSWRSQPLDDKWDADDYYPAGDKSATPGTRIAMLAFGILDKGKAAPSVQGSIEPEAELKQKWTNFRNNNPKSTKSYEEYKYDNAIEKLRSEILGLKTSPPENSNASVVAAAERTAAEAFKGASKNLFRIDQEGFEYLKNRRNLTYREPKKILEHAHYLTEQFLNKHPKANRSVVELMAFLLAYKTAEDLAVWNTDIIDDDNPSNLKKLLELNLFTVDRNKNVSTAAFEKKLNDMEEFFLVAVNYEAQFEPEKQWIWGREKWIEGYMKANKAAEKQGIELKPRDYIPQKGEYPPWLTFEEFQIMNLERRKEYAEKILSTLKDDTDSKKFKLILEDYLAAKNELFELKLKKMEADLCKLNAMEKVLLKGDSAQLTREEKEYVPQYLATYYTRLKIVDPQMFDKTLNETINQRQKLLQDVKEIQNNLQKTVSQARLEYNNYQPIQNYLNFCQSVKKIEEKANKSKQDYDDYVVQTYRFIDVPEYAGDTRRFSPILAHLEYLQLTALEEVPGANYIFLLQDIKNEENQLDNGVFATGQVDPELKALRKKMHDDYTLWRNKEMEAINMKNQLENTDQKAFRRIAEKDQAENQLHIFLINEVSKYTTKSGG